MKKYDVIVIGLGPAGMAVADMATETGKEVLLVESRQIGYENNQTGCIPSQTAPFSPDKNPILSEHFSSLNADIRHIRDNRIMSLANKADILLGKGAAFFVSKDTIRVSNEEYTGEHIFIATGTRPFIPPIAGLRQIDYLTNENLFKLKQIPKSLTLIGGGAIGCEMAQAFARAGCQCTIIHDRPRLLPKGEPDAAKMLEHRFMQMGIRIRHSCVIAHILKRENGHIAIRTRNGLELESEKLMVAAGRSYDFSSLHLDNANVAYNRKGIIVDDYLCTTNNHIYAVGDCNGSSQLSHSAMHQGILAFTNALAKPALRKKYLRYPLPWTVFTDPQISHAGKTSVELESDSIDYEIMETRYSDHNPALVEKGKEGYIRVYCSPSGHIHGVSIVGPHSDEMIHEWATAMQHGVGLHDLMMTMPSFPVMGSLIKRIGETWIKEKKQPGLIKKLLRFLFF
ncbi:MAG: NAD(P)/FAD-dependent oxidoreductase [Oxalobacter formigenes]|nr:NAD(P)/FAD-dependent oxidoreductase [Oxalobacter formigenes]